MGTKDPNAMFEFVEPITMHRQIMAFYFFDFDRLIRYVINSVVNLSLF